MSLVKKHGKVFGYYDGPQPNLWITDLELIKAIFVKDFDHFVDEAIATDGRGHFMSSYDGLEHEVNINGTDYYIYKI